MVKISFQGINGSYTSQALDIIKKAYGFECESVENKFFFKELFDSISCDLLALVPVENSIAGSVVQTTDLFLSHDVEIIAEVKLLVNHCLICSSNCEDRAIVPKKEVLSHIQALSQCSEFISSHDLIPRRFNDTAGAVKEIVEKNDCSKYAIGPEYATFLYGGKVIERNIQNHMENTTRFLLIKQKNCNYNLEENLPLKDKSSLIFELNNEVGSLFNILKILKDYNINILRIESQPHSEKHFSYLFLLDVMADLSNDEYSEVIEQIKENTQMMKLIGSYPSWKN